MNSTPSEVFKAFSILDSCNGCGMCLSICPTKAISGGPGRIHVINEDFCINCGACAKVCQNSSVLDASGVVGQRLSKRNWEIPHFNEAKCTRCGKCYELCPVGIITKPSSLVLPALSNPKLCASCRICQKVCIFNAIEFFSRLETSDILDDNH